ncbi:MAG TPA: thiamine pyrophosphate-binding protein, partial [Candidatus Binatia bacterium]
MASEAEWGSDVVVEMMQRYGIEYAPTNLGATFRALLDSIINFGGNQTPEIIECLHEEIAVGIAMGYGRVTGKPAVALVHNVVGTLHAAMGIYNAYADRTPMIVMSGTGPMGLKKRRPWIDWVHTALVQGNLVRDFVKWDDQPHDPESVPESFIRAHRVAMTEPKGPVYMALDAGWQEAKLSEPVIIPDIAKYAPPTGVQADPSALRKTAELLAAAESPLIVADRAGRNPEAVQKLVELAEAGSIPVVDTGGDLNFPSTHPLDVTGSDAVSRSDVILLLDVDKLEQTFTTSNRYNREKESRLRPGAKVINIGLFDQWIKSTTLDFDRLWPVEYTVAADTSSAIPQLTRELRAVLDRDPSRKKVLAERLERTREIHDGIRKRFRDQLEKGSGAGSISLGMLAHEVWERVKGEPWILTGNIGAWP